MAMPRSSGLGLRRVNSAGSSIANVASYSVVEGQDAIRR